MTPAADATSPASQVGMEGEATPEERRAIAALQRIAKSWPPSLWLFSASGALCVMQKGDDGDRRRLSCGSMDASACLATIKIENDGGDW